MTVPAPSVQPQPIDGGTFRCRYTGTVGVVGTAQTLNIDLTGFPETVREDPYFKAQLIIEFKALNNAISAVTPYEVPDSAFFGEPPEYVQIQVTSDNTSNECAVTVTLPHSFVR